MLNERSQQLRCNAMYGFEQNGERYLIPICLKTLGGRPISIKYGEPNVGGKDWGRMEYTDHLTLRFSIDS